MDALYENLNGWLELLENQIRALRVNQHIFSEVQKIIKANPKIDRPNDFYGWMAENYAAAMSVTVRKLADKDRRAISFRRFLETIKANPSVVSRNRYKRMYVNGNYPEESADAIWDEWIGVGRENIDTSVVESEIQGLTVKIAKLKAFVDKRIAHHDQSDLKGLPTFKELNEAIEYLENLLKRYLLIFTGMET